MKVIVVGAGIIGVTTAWFLARAGHEVIVTERGGAAAQGASHANGGFLSPSCCGPWASPGMPKMVAKALFNAQAPLRWRPDYTVRQVGWLLSMLRECTPGRFAVNRRRMLALGLYSAQCLDEVEQATGLTYARRRSGILQLCHSAAACAAASQQAQALHASGIGATLLARNALLELEPALASHPELAGALHLSDDGSGRCERFAPALAAGLERDGVQFLWNTVVERFDIRADPGSARGRSLESVQVGGKTLKADACVVAAGVDTPALLRAHLSIPVYPVKGFSMTARVLDAQRAPGHAVLDPLNQLAIARFNDEVRDEGRDGMHDEGRGGMRDEGHDEVRVAGYADVVGYDLRLDKRRCTQLVEVFERLYPGAADTARAEFWAGLRPMTPDGTPIVGATDIRGLYLNTGHGTYGWTLSCGSAKLLADIIGGHAPALAPEDYALARYARAGHAH